MIQWTATACGINVEGGREDVAGWRYGDLFLDFRPMRQVGLAVPFCWMISHVPTGMGFVGFMTDLAHAKAAVEEIYPAVDWATLQAGGGAPKLVRAWLDEQVFGWCMPRDTVGPFCTVEHEATKAVAQ